MFVKVCTDIIKLYRKIKGKKIKVPQGTSSSNMVLTHWKNNNNNKKKTRHIHMSGGGGSVGGRGGVTGDLCWAGLVRTGFKNRPVLTVVDRLVMLVSGAAPLWQQMHSYQAGASGNEGKNVMNQKKIASPWTLSETNKQTAAAPSDTHLIRPVFVSLGTPQQTSVLHARTNF